MPLTFAVINTIPNYSLAFQRDLNVEILDISYCLVIQYMPVEQIWKIGIEIDVRHRKIS